MTKFEIKTDDFEFRFGTFKESIPAMSAQEVFDFYMDGTCNDPRTAASFDTLKEAKEEFNKYYANYGRTNAEKSNVFWLLRGEIAWIEANDYDEDGEFNQSDGTYDISAEAWKGE